MSATDIYEIANTLCVPVTMLIPDGKGRYCVPKYATKFDGEERTRTDYQRRKNGSEDIPTTEYLLASESNRFIKAKNYSGLKVWLEQFQGNTFKELSYREQEIVVHLMFLFKKHV